MFLLLDTSTPLCKLILVEGERRYEYPWQADRELAKGLLEHIVSTLGKHNTTIQELKGLGVFRGPGSFTGLRIGISTLNTIAAFENIPIVGYEGDMWQESCLEFLQNGENQKIVLPEYGRTARITKPRK